MAFANTEIWIYHGNVRKGMRIGSDETNVEKKTNVRKECHLFPSKLNTPYPIVEDTPYPVWS